MNGARFIFGVGKYDRIQHVIRNHWLPVSKCIQFKLCLLVFKAVSGLVPLYLTDLWRPVFTVESRQRLHSAALVDLCRYVLLGLRTAFVLCCGSEDLERTAGLTG